MPRNTQSNRGGSKRGRSNNNNPEGYNQYNSGWIDTARERPVAAAGLAAAAVGASVFLWSRRNQISEQLSNLSDQIGEWSESMGSRGGSDEYEMAGGGSSGSWSSGSSSDPRGTSGSGGSSGEFSGSGASGSMGSSGMRGGSGMGTTTGSSSGKSAKSSRGGSGSSSSGTNRSRS